MRQHNKVTEGSTKRKRRDVWKRGLEILNEMNLPKPVTKKARRTALVAARKQARKELQDKKHKRR